MNESCGICCDQMPKWLMERVGGNRVCHATSHDGPLKGSRPKAGLQLFRGWAQTAECSSSKVADETSHDGPREGSSFTARLQLLEEWRQTAEYLSSKVAPRTLELSLVCDLNQQETDLARKIVAPISLFPELKDCHIRLCRSPNTELAQVAQHAAQQACRRLEPHPPPSLTAVPRLLNLPRELRLHILGYADLVTPWREVMWTRAEPRGYRYTSRRRSRDPVLCRPADQHYQFSGCYRQICVMYGQVLYDASIGCFCRLQHAAFSSTCRCWAPPTPLFLICRALAEDARLVFFSLNHFVVSDTLASDNPYLASDFPMGGFDENRRGLGSLSLRRPPPPEPPRPNAYPAQRLAASLFLRDVVPVDCLGHLRFLELVFPPYNEQCWPGDGHPAVQDWADTLHWAKDQINVPSLTLRLTMAGSANIPPESPDERDRLTQAQGDEILAAYKRILRPLGYLGEGGVGGFYAQFVWPWKWSPRSIGSFGEAGAFSDWVTSSGEALNEDAERFMLGDRYRPGSQEMKRKETRPWEEQFTPAYYTPPFTLGGLRFSS